MKKFAEQLKKKTENIRLRTDERNELRERLLAYMEYHPLTESQQLSGRRLARRERSAHAWFMNSWFVARMVSITAVFFLMVVPALAERALPGDILYPVKVRFNEELRGALVSSPYQKIEWETERLERRVAEAQLLADAGKLTPDAEADVANAIRSHSAAAQHNIDSIRISDREEAAIATINLASALEVSAEVLVSQGGGSTGTSSTSAVASAVSEARASVATNNDNPSYQKLMSRIEAETTRAYEYLDGLSNVTTVEGLADIENSLDDIRDKVDTAAEMREVDEAGAAKLLAEALGSTRKVISFMTNLDVRKNVKIEDLVPSTTSEEERRLTLQKVLKENEEMIAEVIIGTDQLATTSTNYMELTEGITYYNELQVSVADALEANDLPAAETAASSAGELAKGLLDNLRTLGISTTTDAAASSSVIIR